MKKPIPSHSDLKTGPIPISGDNMGFTIVELILALGMMIVLMAAMIGLATMLKQTYTTQTVAAGVQQVTRAGLNIMTRNIRMAGFNPLNAAAVGIVAVSENAFRFEYDLDGSGVIEEKADPREDVSYLRNANSQLIRQTDGNSATNISLVDHVSALQFRYLDKDNNETGDVNAIRAVEISLTVQEPSGRGRPVIRTYQTRVVCRNLGL